MRLAKLTKGWTEWRYKEFFSWYKEKWKKDANRWWVIVDVPERLLKEGDEVSVIYSPDFDRIHDRIYQDLNLYEMFTKETATRLNTYFKTLREPYQLALKELNQTKTKSYNNADALCYLLSPIAFLKKYCHDITASPITLTLDELLDCPITEQQIKRILEIKELVQTIKRSPTRYPREYLLSRSYFISPKKQLTEKEILGEKELWGKLPGLADRIMLTCFYFIDPRYPFEEITRTPKEWLEALGNTKYITSTGKETFAGSSYKEFDEMTTLMTKVHHGPIWQDGWVREKGKKKPVAWKFEGTLLATKRTRFYREKDQKVKEMSDEERQKLRRGQVSLKPAEALISGEGIGFGSGYHAELMDLFHWLGKNWLAKQIVGYMLAQSSMVVPISKYKLLAKCFDKEGKTKYLRTYYPRALKRLENAQKLLLKGAVFENIERDIPYAYKQKDRERYFDRYYKSPDYFYKKSEEKDALPEPSKIT